MNVLCAPDSFKDSISAIDASAAMVRGAQGFVESAIPCPIADGGEGTLDVLIDACDGRLITAGTLDPLGRPHEARIGFLDNRKIAVVEMAEASGIEQLKTKERNPFRTSSYGTGHLMAIAARDVEHILLTAGGTATMDGGCGILQAFGSRLLNSIGEPIEDPITNGTLPRISSIEIPRHMPRIDVAVDVQATLLGEKGAAYLFGHQKGARPEDIEVLDANLLHIADVMDPDGRHRLVPGGGAAGGAAFGLHAMVNARIISGSTTVLDMIEFGSKLQGIDVLMVGEGRLDQQSLLGKAPFIAAKQAHDIGIETIAVCGCTGEGWEAALVENGGPIDRIVSLSEQHGNERSLLETAACIEETVQAILSDR